MPHPIEQLLASLTKKPTPRGFDPDYLNDESIDPSVRADAGAGAMEGELRNRLFQAERSQQTPAMSTGVGTSPHEVNALGKLLGGYTKQRASSPLVPQQAEYDAQRGMNLEAINEGFTGDQTGSGSAMSPVQQRQIYRREQEKQNQPFNLEQAKYAHEVGMQGRQQQAAQQVIETQMAPSQSFADVNREQWESMQAGGIDPTQVKQIGRSGLQFQTTPRNPSTAQFDRDLSTARFNLGNRDPFADPNSTRPEIQNFWQTARNRVSNSGLDANLQNEFMEWLQDPTWNGVQQSFEEAFPPPPSPDPNDPSDQASYRKDSADWLKLKQLVVLLKGSV